MTPKKRILVAPLNWGLGHASRCIPIIQELLKRDFEVVIGASNKPLALLRKEFPELEYILLPGMNVAYPKYIPLSVFMVIKAPYFLKWVKRERRMLQSAIKNYHIDAVISDNRYGLTNDAIPSVLVLHQLFVKAGPFSIALKKLTEKYVSKFDLCWIPDTAEHKNLSGTLSHGKTKLTNLRYIGPLSRFKFPKYHKPNKRYDLLVILSGPEPSRTILEATLMKQLLKTELKVLMVRGLVDAEKNDKETIKNINRFNFLTTEELQKAILMSRLVVCRSGYSSIMDLAVLQSKALFVPTNGQTEQEYLAKMLKVQDMALYVRRNKLNIQKQYDLALIYKGLSVDLEQDKQLKQLALDELEQLISNQDAFYSLPKVG